jgi:hypothetical protein
MKIGDLVKRPLDADNVWGIGIILEIDHYGAAVIWPKLGISWEFSEFLELAYGAR